MHDTHPKRTPRHAAARMALAAALLLGMGCSPTLNWREVSGDGITALLPCKPDQTEQAQNLADRTLRLKMMGCEAGEALWAIASAELPDENEATRNDVQRAWQTGLERALQTAGTSPSRALRVAGGSGLEGKAVTLQGKSAEGTPLRAEALWFAQGRQLYLAVVYGNSVNEDQLETFRSGLRLR